MTNQLFMILLITIAIYIIIEEIRPGGKKYIRYNLYERWAK